MPDSRLPVLRVGKDYEVTPVHAVSTNKFFVRDCSDLLRTRHHELLRMLKIKGNRMHQAPEAEIQENKLYLWKDGSVFVRCRVDILEQTNKAGVNI